MYLALMERLGYSSNRRAFVQLASLAPYEAVSRAARKLPPGDRGSAIGEWLTDCSGLGSSSHIRPKGIASAMGRREWHLFRVRPTNHPRRRILAAAMLLDRFLEQGLAAGLREEVHREEVHRSSPARLTAALCAQSRTGAAYVGRGRAIDLAVNAVLPFMHAGEGEIPCGSGAGVAEGLAEGLYERFPLLGDNEITREMTPNCFRPVGMGR